MSELPFLHPALVGVGVAGALAWSAVAPGRWRSPLLAATAGAAVGIIAGLAGWVPWLGGLRLTAYGGLLLAAFALAWGIARRRARRLGGTDGPCAGIPTWFVREQLAIAAIAGILGARIWYVIEYRAEFPDPRAGLGAWLGRAADLDVGGAVWFGGLALAAIAMLVHARRCGVALLPWADVAAPAVLAAQAIGRIGCFCNGCCYGRPTLLPWGIHRHDGSLVHPTQLYETLACTVLALLVARVAPGRGAPTGWAVLGYAGWRFINETLRGDYANNHVSAFSLSPPSLTSAQWLCLPLAALGTWLVLRARRAGNPAPAALPTAPAGPPA